MQINYTLHIVYGASLLEMTAPDYILTKKLYYTLEHR